jgi:hypothetical protein
LDIEAMPTAVSEAARVLTPAGRLGICVTHPMTDVGQFAERAAQAPFVITGSYLEDRAPPYAGKIVERDGLRMTFHSLRYSLEEYARALEDASLVIEAVREPPVPKTEVARDPAEGRWQRLPNFLMPRAARARSV